MTITRRNASSVALAKRRIAHLRGLSEGAPIGVVAQLSSVPASRSNEASIEAEVVDAELDAAEPVAMGD